MRPDPRNYDTPDDYYDAVDDYVGYIDTMYERVDMEIEKQKEDERLTNEKA